MLTTTIDGLWVLQILAGIEVIAPELGLRPILPSFETAQKALGHPIAAELHAAGVIDEAGTVDAAVVEWLTVLSRRDVALLVYVRNPEVGEQPARAVVVRFAQWWVVMERSEDLVRIGGAGIATAEGTANAVLMAQIDRLCGTNTPAPFRPSTLDVDALLAGVTSQESLKRFLITQQMDADQQRMLLSAADPSRSTQSSIVALQSVFETGCPTGTFVGTGTVTIIDSPAGRLVTEQLQAGGKNWVVAAPGSATNIAAAINSMFRRLPASTEWFSYRKAV